MIGKMCQTHVSEIERERSFRAGTAEHVVLTDAVCLYSLKRSANANVP